MEENRRHASGVGHEESDANAVAVGKFGIGLLFTIILCLVLLFGLFHYFQSQETGVVKNVDPTKAFPLPRLQEKPIADLKEIRDAEDALLASYAWVDQQKGVVRIPIDRAIDLLAKRGLPSRAEAPAASTVSVPTESGLGPKMRLPGGPLASELK